MEIKIENGVTSIDAYTFLDCEDLTSVIIPASVTSIGTSAFEGCVNLTTVIFAENSQCSSIGDSAFCGCSSLTALAIPDSVTNIGRDAFYGCPALADVASSELLATIDEEKLANKSADERFEETQKLLNQLENVLTDKIFILLGESDGYSWEESCIIKFSDYASGNFVFPNSQVRWQQPEGTLEFTKEELPDGFVLLWDEVNFGNDEYDISEIKSWFLANRS